MVQVIEQSTPFGKLAENFGRSLGESTGQEFSRQVGVRRLPQILEQLQSEGVPDQLALTTALLQIPGMDQQKLQLYMPLLQQGLRQKAAGQLAGAGVPGIPGVPGVQQEPVQNVSEQTPQQTAQAGNQNARVLNTGVDAKQPITTLMTPEQEQSLTQQQKVLTPQQITGEAYRLMTQNPGLYPTLEMSEQAVRDQLQADNTSLQNLQSSATAADARTKEIRTKTTDRITAKLQTQNLQDAWSQLPGTLQDNLINEAIGLVRDGKTADQAAEAVGKKAVQAGRQIKDFMAQPDFTDSVLTLEDISSGKAYDPKLLKKLSGYRSFFESVGGLEEYKSLLQTKGAGEFMSSLIAYPPSIQAEKEIVKVRKQKKEKEPEVLAKNLAKSIQPTDSIQSLAYLINQEGLDEKDFYSSISQLQQSGEIELTDIQERELNQDLPVTQTLYDIFAASGSNPYGLFKALKRRSTGRI